MAFWRNVASVVKDPALLGEYGQYLVSRAIYRGHARRPFYDGLQLGGFTGFSEYHSSKKLVSQAEQQLLSSLRIPEGVLVDVGANLGAVSLLLARRYPARDVYAFEPNPSALTSLVSNVRLNGLSNVRPQAMAVAAESGSVQFHVDPKSRMTGSIASGTSSSVNVPCTTLDAFTRQHSIDRVALLKVDVEGFEQLVFQGAGALLRDRKIGIVYYEVCPPLARSAGFTASAATETLIASGYSVKRLNASGQLVPATPKDVEFVELDNWIAVSDAS